MILKKLILLVLGCIGISEAAMSEESAPIKELQARGVSVGRLPPDGHLVLSLNMNAELDANCKLVAQEPEFAELSLFLWHRSEDHSVASLAGHRGLRKLHITAGYVTPKTLQIVPTLPKLAHLSCRLGDNAVESLKLIGQAKQLKTLALEESKLTDDGLLHLKDLNDLEEVRLNGTEITTQGLKFVVGKQRLRQIGVGGCRKIDDSICDIANRFPDLEELFLEETAVTDAGILRLAGLRKLTTLSVSETKVTKESVRVIADFQNLEWLFMEGIKVDEWSVKLLCGMRKLKYLYVNEADISKRDIRHMKSQRPDLDLIVHTPK